MKYINSCGTLCVSSEKDCKFYDFMTAVMALNAIQLFYAHLGFSVSSSIYKETKHVEVRISFESYVMPSLPAGYLYTRREITSHSYTGYGAKPCERCRVLSYCFDF